MTEFVERQGRVTAWDEDKGYGYVVLDDPSQPGSLLQIAALHAGGFKSVRVGNVLRYEAMNRPRGWEVFRVFYVGK